MNLIETLKRMARSAEFEYSHWATDELDSLKKEDREAIETVRAMQEALRDALSQMDMAGDCIEAGRYDEALLHVRSLHRPKRDILHRAEGNAG